MTGASAAENTDEVVVRSEDGQVVVAFHDETTEPSGLPPEAATAGVKQTALDWAELALTTLQGEGVRHGNLEVFLVDEQRITDLNRQHLAGTGPTDVLAFPIDSPVLGADDIDVGATDVGAAEVERHLGDVVICPTIVAAQASDHAGSFDAEMSLLVIHGVLHILGHDHYEPEEAEIMQAKERDYMSSLGFTHPGPPSTADKQSKQKLHRTEHQEC